MRAVTVSPFAQPPAPAPTRSVLDKALEFERRWTKHRPAIPTDAGPWSDKCMAYYADFAVTFTTEPKGFDVRKRSDFATDEILKAVIELVADIHNATKNHEKAEEY